MGLKRRIMLLLRGEQNYIRASLKKPDLFRGEDALFKKEIQGTQSLLEFGIGQSTVFASTMPSLKEIVSVDTSLDWIKIVDSITEGVSLVHLDVGDLGEWGAPLSYEKISNYWYGVEKVLEDYPNTELVLVDGRLRVFTFLMCMKSLSVGTRIIFDDYDRVTYQIVETIFEPEIKNDTQALFVVTDDYNKKNLEELMNQFKYVLE